MIEINLLPPKERSTLSLLIVPLALIVVGLGLAAFLIVGYVDSLDSAESSRQQLAATEQKQSELQSELQTLGQSEGLHGNAGDMIEALRKLRPDLDALLTELESPLSSGSTLETVKLNEDGSLAWTCSFPGLTEAGAYSVAIQKRSGAGAVFIQSLREQGTQFIGSFQLTPGQTPVKAGNAE